jgi:DNA-binding PadR family transcriptional regulator
MSGGGSRPVELLQGTLDLIVLRALATMGPLHAYALAARLEQVADHPLTLNQGTLYPALVRLEQRGWIKGTWKKTENNRDAKYYAITAGGPLAAARRARRQAADERMTCAGFCTACARCCARARPSGSSRASCRPI